MLTTARLRLRRWHPHDLGPFAAMNADPEVMEFFPATITVEQAGMAMAIFEEQFAQHGYGFWAVELSDSGAFVGNVGLEPYDLKNTTDAQPTAHVAIGWQLARDYWGQGFAREAAQVVVDYAKNHLKLNEMISIMAERNARSRRVCERLGMIEDKHQTYEDANFPLGHPFRRQSLYRLAIG